MHSSPGEKKSLTLDSHWGEKIPDPGFTGEYANGTCTYMLRS